jgi:hypothetical protein
LGTSAKSPGTGLCSNPGYIKSVETCQSVIGAPCDYYDASDRDPADLRYISFQYTGQENRQFSRTLIYNSMLLGIVKRNEVVEYPSIILDISSEGIGCIIPIIIESFPREFYLTKTFSSKRPIILICETSRVIKHSYATEIGASFKERLSDEIVALLYKIG